jgi:uncharacterized protein with von Willebrand factor type A (vWA) domain
MAAIEGVGAETADALFKLGWRSAADVANAKPEELSSVAGIGGADVARKVISAASRAAEIERRQQAEESARAAQAEREAAEAGEAPERGGEDHGAAVRTPGGP